MAEKFLLLLVCATIPFDLTGTTLSFLRKKNEDKLNQSYQNSIERIKNVTESEGVKELNLLLEKTPWEMTGDFLKKSILDYTQRQKTIKL